MENYFITSFQSIKKENIFLNEERKSVLFIFFASRFSQFKKTKH